MKIDREKLIEDLQDTVSNNFKEEVVDYLFDKYSNCGVITEDNFDEAMYEFLNMIINFIKSAKR